MWAGYNHSVRDSYATSEWRACTWSLPLEYSVQSSLKSSSPQTPSTTCGQRLKLGKRLNFEKKNDPKNRPRVDTKCRQSSICPPSRRSLLSLAALSLLRLEFKVLAYILRAYSTREPIFFPYSTYVERPIIRVSWYRDRMLLLCGLSEPTPFLT